MKMHHHLVTGKGVAVPIGAELGVGGEGSVFEVRGTADQVVKLYHQALSASKQAKIVYMASKADAELLKYAAWPQEPVYNASSGAVVGFLMPSAKGLTALHALYSPAHRKQEMPSAAWNFLVVAARNAAAVFEAVHKRGYVLGDVNENTGSVSKTARVTLLDCDSMQIVDGGQRWLCEVGVPHFTPPELQSTPSFDSVVRTANHDNFGLALIIFQLLFGGRHPYSGVPDRKGVGDSLEGNIKLLAFAYARDAQSRGIKPPPRSIPLALVPESMASMFTAAFTERGVQGKRPTAQEWVVALDGLRNQLQGCSKSKMHIYSRHLKACPWCTLEQHSVVYFVDIAQAYVQSASAFDLAKLWAQIEAVQMPASPAMPAASAQQVTGRPMPQGGGNFAAWVLRVVVVLGALGCLVAVPVMWFVIIPVAIWLFNKADDGSSQLNAEKADRGRLLRVAAEEYARAEAKLGARDQNDRFQQQLLALRKLRDEYKQLGSFEQKELSKYQSQAQERQLQKYLSQFFIDQAAISGVGPAKRAALRSWGIETAADVEWARVLSVKGFGESLTRAVVVWRKSCEAGFRFNPASAMSPSDLAAVKANTARYRRQLEDGLGAGLTELNQLRKQALQRNAAHMETAQHAARKLAQAQADAAVAG